MVAGKPGMLPDRPAPTGLSLSHPSAHHVYLLVSFGDKALQVVPGTGADTHCSFSYFLLTRQAAKFPVLIVDPILRVITKKDTTEQQPLGGHC